MQRCFLFPLVLLLTALAVLAQKYDGPRPPQKDLPYLKHAATLIPTEAVVAKEEDSRNGNTYIIAGAGSPVATPLASPIFLVQVDKIVPERMELYKLESKNGRREIFFPKSSRKGPPGIRLEVTRMAGENLWQIEVEESLEPGEYSLTLQDDPSNKAYCFQVR